MRRGIVDEKVSSEREDDVVLVARVLADPAAFAELYERYVLRIHQYLLMYARSPDEAADLTQIVFLRAFQALPTWRNESSVAFRAWLFRIARNAATDASRRRSRHLPWSHVPVDTLVSSEPRPESAALTRELLEYVSAIVGGLSPLKQEILALRFAGDLSIAEISLVVGKSEAAVRKQLSRTLETLKEQIDAWYA